MTAVPSGFSEEEFIRRVNCPSDLPPNREVSSWIAGHFEPGYRGFCVDVGASDGRFINSTWCLERELLWTVLSVEANPLLKRLLMKERAFVKMCAVGSEPADDVDFQVNLDNLEAFSSLKPAKDHKRYKQEAGKRWKTIKVNVRTLEQLLAEAEFPRLDALCIDVEGGEADVMKGLDWKRWRPRAVIVEAWDSGTHDGFLIPLGYERAWKSAENDCYRLK